MEVKIDEQGRPVDGEAFSCWDGSIQKKTTIRQIEAGTNQEAMYRAFESLLYSGLGPIEQLYDNDTGELKK